MRNIGASIGISTVETFQVRSQQKHVHDLVANVIGTNLAAQNLSRGFTGYFMSQGSDMVTASHRAYAAIFGMVQRQAAIMAYNDTFMLLAIMFVAVSPCLLLLKKPEKKAGAAMAH
jgi:DHA2 family multidrug resistance protein